MSSGNIIAMMLFTAVFAYGQLPAARITATREQLDAVCGTHAVKLVFVCGNQAYFVDFSDETPRIVPMAGVTNAWFPVISSDGQWVTYQRGVEAEGPSTNPVPGTIWFRELAENGTPVKVADTGYVPRFVRNTPADTPAIVYATSVDCGLDPCYSVGRTVRRRIVNNVPFPEETVFTGGSYYGGLSWDNRYLVTGWPGGPDGFMLDLNDAAAEPRAVHTMRVTKNGTDSDTFVSVGTCNISSSSSRLFTNTMLFYDFGSSALTAAKCRHPFLGTWKQHELLFISRYDAEALKVFAMPADRKLIPVADAQGAGEAIGKEWYFPEWSNHPYIAVAGLNIDRLWLENGDWEHTYNTESMYLVSLRDSLYVKLVESTDTSFTSVTGFNYPFIWVELPTGFREDSTWLATTIRERSAVSNPFGNRKRIATADGVLSDPQITEISLFDLSGRTIARFWPAFGSTLKQLRKRTGPGSYLLKISLGGKREYLRIVHLQ